jgi:hypothetical protein
MTIDWLTLGDTSSVRRGTSTWDYKQNNYENTKNIRKINRDTWIGNS